MQVGLSKLQYMEKGKTFVSQYSLCNYYTYCIETVQKFGSECQISFLQVFQGRNNIEYLLLNLCIHTMPFSLTHNIL